MRNDSLVVADFVTITSTCIGFATLVKISLCIDFVAYLYGSRRKLTWFLSVLSMVKCESFALAS